MASSRALRSSLLGWRRSFTRGAAQAAVELDSGSGSAWHLPSVPISSPCGLHWVFLGCPGVGKGTYASKLSSLLAVPHIAMGDLVRHELKQSGPLSRELHSLMSQGKLLPDEVILGLLTKRFEEGVANKETGFILDGFPRTSIQAKALDTIADINLVVNLRLREDILITKCLGRRTCSQCGGNFNVAEIDVDESESSPRIYMPPLLPPPACAQKLVIRLDDNEEVVRERMRVYAAESKPVEDYYRVQGKLLDFDISGGIPETWPRLVAALNLEDKLGSKTEQIAA